MAIAQVNEHKIDLLEGMVVGRDGDWDIIIYKNGYFHTFEALEGMDALYTGQFIVAILGLGEIGTANTLEEAKAMIDNFV